MHTKIARFETSAKDLRNFGFIMAVAIGGIFGLLMPQVWGFSMPVWPWPIAGAFLLFALSCPNRLDAIYVVWMKFGNVMGGIMSRIILSIIFFAVVTPIGVLKRIVDGESMAKPKSATGEKSFRKVRSTTIEPKSMENPY